LGIVSLSKLVEFSIERFDELVLALVDVEVSLILGIFHEFSVSGVEGFDELVLVLVDVKVSDIF